MNQEWKGTWERSKSKLRIIKQSITLWSSESNLKRRDQVVLNRLQTGHTRLNQAHFDRQASITSNL